MPVSLSIKNVPEEVVERLRQRARRSHRSLQGELLTILEEALQPKRLSVQEVSLQLKQLGFSTPAEAVTMIREDRDAR